MEYDEEDNGAAGSIPEFGAIFMSSFLTKKECFKRKMFALPSSKLEFVERVKAGMVLFLFEYEKRQLFGVYQASSDGAMDIVPHGFNYSGKRFPAQVCFKPIWYCAPLSEKEFQGAIRENYFSPKKFNFGLSEHQVHRLLSLFSSRKLKNKMPPHPPADAVFGVAGKDRGLVGDDRFALSERRYMEPTKCVEFNPALFSDYQVNSFARAEEDDILIDDGFNAQEEVYPFAQEDFLAKRRRLDNDDRLITNDVAENGIYNYGTLWTLGIDSPKDSLDEVRKLADTHRLLTVERVCNGNLVDKILNPVPSSEYLMSPLNVRTTDDDRFMQTNKLFGDYNMDNGSGEAFANKRYGKPSDKGKHAIDDERFLFDNSVQREHNVCDIVKPMVYGDGNLNLHRRAREVIDDRQYLMNRKLENRYPLDYDHSPVSTFGHSASLLHKIRKTTASGRFPINDRSESGPNIVSCPVEGLSSEKLSLPLHCDRGIIRDRKHPMGEGRVTENMVDSILCPAVSIRNTGCISGVDGRVVNDGRFSKSERVDHEEVDISPVMSEYPPFSKQRQHLSSFSAKLPEKGLSQLAVGHNFDPSCTTFDDATIMRAVPYIPEQPNFFHGCSASMASKLNSGLVLENHPRHGSLENFDSFSKNRQSPYFLESEKSRSLGLAPEFVNKGLPTNTPGYRSSLLCEATSSYPKPNLSMRMDLTTSTPRGYMGSLASKHSLTSLPSSSHENTEREKGFLFAHPSKSSENHFALDGNLPTPSQHARERVPQHEMDMLAGQDFICSEAKDFRVVYHPERDLANYKNQYLRFSNEMNCKEHHTVSEPPHFDSSVNRKSVFSRLTSGQESQIGKDRKDDDFNYGDCYMNATADEVMEMLQQGNNLPLRMLRKFKVVGQSKLGETAVDEKQIQNHAETNHSTTENKSLNGACITIAESIGEVPKETRIVDFRRRSDTKKNLVGANSDSATDNKITGVNEETASPMKKNLKRRKLVRPVFKKIESAMDTICGNQNLQLPGQILDKDNKLSCEGAISISKVEMPNDGTGLSNVSVDYNIKEHSNPKEQEDIGAHVLPSISDELKGHKTSNAGLQIGSPQVLKEKNELKGVGVQAPIEGISPKYIDPTVSSLNLEESSLKAYKLGADCGSKLREKKSLGMLICEKKIIRNNRKGEEPSQ